MFTHTHDIGDDWTVLNDEPGLGFTFDQEKLDAHAVAEHDGSFGWGRRQGAVMYVAGPGELNRCDTV